MELKRVVVTGLGTINALGHTAEETWTNMINGVSGAGPITNFDASKFKTKFACEVKNYDPLNYFKNLKQESSTKLLNLQLFLLKKHFKIQVWMLKSWILTEPVLFGHPVLEVCKLLKRK
jgi:3-oxoacyl-(acyl-carrier-protein) synthase